MYAPPPAIRALWPTPLLGDWAVRDVTRPVPIAGGDGFRQELDNLPDNEPDGEDSPTDDVANTGVGQPVDVSVSQAIAGHYVPRGIEQQGAYEFQTFNNIVSHVVTHSLGREILYNWADAQFNVGGVGYPLDYGFGPGYHGDATIEQGNVQLYMKPGLYRRPAAK